MYDRHCWNQYVLQGAGQYVHGSMWMGLSLQEWQSRPTVKRMGKQRRAIHARRGTVVSRRKTLRLPNMGTPSKVANGSNEGNLR